jgi:hypothetical protein
LCQFCSRRFWITTQTWDLLKFREASPYDSGYATLGHPSRIKVQESPAHPSNPLKPLRVTSAVDHDDLRESLAVRLLDAAWNEGRDITSDTVICEIADSVGLNGQELLSKAQTVGIKERLRLQTERAIQVPTFPVDDEIFWGNDRLPLLNAHLQGKLPTDKPVAVAQGIRFRNAPRGAVIFKVGAPPPTGAAVFPC